MILSTQYENMFLDLLRGYPIPAITDFYVGLVKTDNTEVVAASYGRVHIDALPGVWVGTHGSVSGPSTGSLSLITNAVNISWGTALENWGTVDRVRFYLAASGVSYFCDHPISSTPILSGATVEILTGDFIISTNPEAVGP
jgi:hypothetical protein